MASFISKEQSGLQIRKEKLRTYNVSFLIDLYDLMHKFIEYTTVWNIQ